MVNKSDLFEFIKTVVYGILICCLFTAGGYGFSFVYGAINDNREVIAENTRLQNIISAKEDEIVSLKEEINTLNDTLQQEQVIVIKEATDDDFLCLIDDYYSLLYNLDYITYELSSIMSDLEYARTEDDRNDVYFEMEKLQDKIYEFEEEAEEIISYYL